MFDKQVKKATFNKQNLSHILYGGKDKFDQFQAILSTISNDPVMKFDPSVIHQSRADMMAAYARKTMKFHTLYPLDGATEIIKTNLFCHALPLSLHGLMFLTTLRNLCDQQQVKMFLEPALHGQIIGCYAQTQLAHGSDVQNLLTTATYDQATESFVINTPEIGAAKWWIGDLGLYCNHGAVFAQLIINGKNYGVHVFLVPIRNPKTLQVLKGIQAGDVGPKHGFQIKDNGYAIFSNFRIPRRNMLMKYHTVSKQGKYAIQGDEKISYATMLMTRAGLISISSFIIAKATTIATRYSMLRTQFKNSKGQQIPVIQYQTQQEKIIPRIAETYATWFTAKSVTDLAIFVFDQSRKGRFNRLNEAHVLTSGIKAIFTYDIVKGAQILRKSAGGHGFHMYNGINALLIQYTPVLTVEGQYTVLLIQVARFMLKSLSQMMKGKPLAESAKYLEQLKNGDLSVQITDQQSLNCPHFIRKILVSHSCSKIKDLATKVSKLMGQKLSQKEIQDHHVGILMNEAAVAHCYVTIYDYFFKEVSAITDIRIKAVLTNLLLFYGIDKILERAARFYQTSTLNSEAFINLNRKKQALLNELRPQSLGLMEAFGYDDSILMSAIGASNGKPYENLIEWAQQHNSINKPQNRGEIIRTIKQAKSELRPRL